jgi:hypothetical protein
MKVCILTEFEQFVFLVVGLLQPQASSRAILEELHKHGVYETIKSVQKALERLQEIGYLESNGSQRSNEKDENNVVFHKITRSGYSELIKSCEMPRPTFPICKK